MWFWERIEGKLDDAMRLLRIVAAAQIRIVKDIQAMSPELKKLSDAVAANTAVEASAVLLIKGIAEQLAASKDDPAAVAALAAQLEASTAALAAAVSENTPAPAPEPAPAPPADPV